MNSRDASMSLQAVMRPSATLSVAALHAAQARPWRLLLKRS